MFLNAKYIENGTRQSYTYNGSLMIYQLVPFSMALNGHQTIFQWHAIDISDIFNISEKIQGMRLTQL